MEEVAPDYCLVVSCAKLVSSGRADECTLCTLYGDLQVTEVVSAVLRHLVRTDPTFARRSGLMFWTNS